MTSDDIVVTAVARTPFGRFNGALKDIPGPELAGRTIDATIARAGVAEDEIDAAYIGFGLIAAATLTPARQAVLMSSLPNTMPSLTVNCACCSGMTAIGLGLKNIRLGVAKAVLCGGCDNLSAKPLLPRQRTNSHGGGFGQGDAILLTADPQ
jgi:acetyl-CoA C-acetyltransferase